MSTIRDQVLSANDTYAAEFGERSELALPPARRFAILTCMDARLDPAKYAGLSEGDAHVIRNAGGRASDDAIRSLVISYKLLGTAEWFVVHHTDCGMEFFTNEIISDLLASSLETAALGPDGFYDVGSGPGHTAGSDIDWLTIADQNGERRRGRPADPEPSARAQEHPDPRVPLRRPNGPPRRGGRRDGRRPRGLGQRPGPRTRAGPRAGRPPPGIDQAAAAGTPASPLAWLGLAR